MVFTFTFTQCCCNQEGWNAETCAQNEITARSNLTRRPTSWAMSIAVCRSKNNKKMNKQKQINSIYTSAICMIHKSICSQVTCDLYTFCFAIDVN